MKNTIKDGGNKRWKGVDWGKRDIEIARELGVSRQCVFSVRNDVLQKPKSQKMKHHLKSAYMVLKDVDTENKTLMELSKKYGYSYSHIWTVLLNLGKGWKKDESKYKTEYDWGSISADEYLTLRNCEIARILGIDNPAIVAARRTRYKKADIRTHDLGKFVREQKKHAQSRVSA